jgi:hypothetical protein
MLLFALLFLVFVPASRWTTVAPPLANARCLDTLTPSRLPVNALHAVNDHT